MLAAKNIINLRRKADQLSEIGALLLNLINIVIAVNAFAKNEGRNLAVMVLFLSIVRAVRSYISLASKKRRAWSGHVDTDETNLYVASVRTQTSSVTSSVLALVFIPIFLNSEKSDALQAAAKVMLAEATLTLLKQFVEISLYRSLSLPRIRIHMQNGAHRLLLARDDHGIQELPITYLPSQISPIHQAVFRIILENNWQDFNLLVALHSSFLNINTRCNPGQVTPLHIAVANQHQELVQRLLELGADPNAYDAVGMKPLHYALVLRNYNLIKTLTEITGLTMYLEANSRLNYLMTLIMEHPVPASLRACMARSVLFGETEAEHIEVDNMPKMLEAVSALEARGVRFNLSHLEGEQRREAEGMIIRLREQMRRESAWARRRVMALAMAFRESGELSTITSQAEGVGWDAREYNFHETA